ncbi:MAG: hypothetical protein MRZ79_19825 [Bacteroidia bacterium]|nr:hypothetical protein [Bacteroidia bacterium]
MINPEIFEPLVSQDFFIPLNEKENLRLVLNKIEIFEAKENEKSAPQGFALMFNSPGEDRYLNQGTYSVKNEKLGEMNLFMVPRGTGEDGMQYEVIFN